MIAVLLGAAHLDMSALDGAFKTAGWEPRTVRSEAALIEGGQRGSESDAAGEELDGRAHRRSAILLPVEAEGVNTGARMVRTLRRNRIRIPIVLVTSSLDRQETRNAVAAALRSGADDFFISSISHAELALRLTALVERSRRRDAVGVIRIGDLEVDNV
jgi:DNA-binding response OmpR family regulator